MDVNIGMRSLNNTVMIRAISNGPAGFESGTPVQNVINTHASPNIYIGKLGPPTTDPLLGITVGESIRAGNDTYAYAVCVKGPVELTMTDNYKDPLHPHYQNPRPGLRILVKNQNLLVLSVDKKQNKLTVLL